MMSSVAYLLLDEFEQTRPHLTSPIKGVQQLAKLSIMRNILIERLAKRVYSEIVSRRGECTLRDNYRLDELAHSQSARVEHVAKQSVMRKLLQVLIAEHRARDYDSKQLREPTNDLDQNEGAHQTALFYYFRSNKHIELQIAGVSASYILQFALMIGQQRLQPAQFEQRCQECCFATDKEVKRQAELLLNQVVPTMSLTDLEYILQGSSQIAVFVVCEYLFQNIEAQSDAKGLAQLLVTRLLSWRVGIDSFIRGGQQFKPFVLNSLKRLIGQLMKRIFNFDQQSKTWLFEFIKSADQQARLLLWTYLITSVSEMDVKMGFLAYRGLSYSFQDEAMCQLMQTVMPYFNRLSEGVKFNELAALQSNLSVNETQQAQPVRVLSFTPQELTLASLIIELLRSVVTFTYNVTYSEFEMENSYENTAICFPQRLKQILSASDFYESLFYLSERFVLEQPDNELLRKCLQCLQKIVLCRLSYDKKELRRAFIQQSIKGITKLMSLTNQPVLYREFVEFNKKMINNFSLKKFRKCEPYFTDWLRHIEGYVVRTVQTGKFTFDNTELKEALELLVKLVEGSINIKMVEYVPLLKSIAQNVLGHFLTRALRSNENMMRDINLRKMKHLRSLSSEVFSYVRVLFCINFGANCTHLQEVEIELFQRCVKSGDNFHEVANFLLLLTEMSITETVGYNVYKDVVKPCEFSGFAQLYTIAFDFIKLYQQNKTIEDPNHRYTDMAILLLFQRLLTEVLQSIEVPTEKPKPIIATTNRLYLALRVRAMGDTEVVDQFLLDSFQLILGYMKSKDRLQVDYSMECLSSCLTKLKWGVRRDIFKDMDMPSVIINYCVKVAKQEFLQPPFVKCRINLFKIITVAGFDDCLDNYREKLKYVFDAMHLNPTHQNYHILIYDIRGIANQIDARPVYRFFLKRILPTLRLLFGQYLINNQQQGGLELIKQALKLCRTLLENKSQRLTLALTAPVSYELVNVLLPYMLEILVELNRQTTHDFEMEVPIATQLFRSFNEIMKGGYINFFLLANMSRVKTESYLQQLLRYLECCYKVILNYPKAFEHYLLCCDHLAKELSELIFSLGNNDTVMLYCSMFTVCYKLAERLLREHRNGNTKNDKHLDRAVETMTCCLMAVRQALMHTHKPTNLASAELFKFSHYEEKMEMIVGLFLEIVQQKDSTHLHGQLCRTLYNFVRLYPESLERVDTRFRTLYVHGYASDKLEALYRPATDTDCDSEQFSTGVTIWCREIDSKAASSQMTEATEY